jgi:hypothetical protein
MAAFLLCATLCTRAAFGGPIREPDAILSWTFWWRQEQESSAASTSLVAPGALMQKFARTAIDAGGAQTISNVPSVASAYIDMTTGAFPNADTLTSGGAQPWYVSPSVIHAFGHTPDTAQQVNFTQTVLSDVQQTFHLSGLNPTITADPLVPALHTISVVSGTVYPSNPGAIGITNVGGNGFNFIDKLNYAQNATQLAWAIAHNIAHEMMHAFGIGFHPDQTGNYIDSATANWALLTSPSARFSPSAAQLMLASQFGTLSGSPQSHVSAEIVDSVGAAAPGGKDLSQAVPEPSAALLWALAAAAFLMIQRGRHSSGITDGACGPLASQSGVEIME